MAKTKDKSNLKEIAEMLFLQANQKQKEIAAKLGVSEVTVSRWAKEGNWDSMKKNLLTEKRKRLGELYDELREFNRMIQEKQEYKVATSREADARRKLITDIKDLEGRYSIAQTTTIGMDFCEFVKQTDAALAERVMEFFNAFINDTIEKNKWQE